MRRFFMIGLVIVLSTLLCLILYGCKPKSSTDSSAPTLDSLFQSWHTMASLRRENVDYVTVLQLSKEIVTRYGNEGIERIFKVIETPEESPMAKMLAVMSLTPFVTEKWTERLKSLTTPEKEVNTRVCALHLLQLIRTDDVTEYIKTLVTDTEERVRFGALTALASREEPMGIEKINELWENAKDQPERREHILTSIPSSHIKQFLPIFREAIQDTRLSHSLRRQAIINIGHHGSEEDIPYLEKFVDTEIENDLKELAQGALDNIILHSRKKDENP